MSARYRIRHHSRYVYKESVAASFNEARLTPLSLPWQVALESDVDVDQASWLYRYVDYWGTQVRVFEVGTPHRDLVVNASSLVEVDAARRPVADEAMSWDALHQQQSLDAYCEFLPQTHSTEPPADLAALAEELAGSAATPRAAAHAINDAVYEAMTYEAGSTGVATVAGEAWAARKGVCQDYAHLVVGALRHVGIPARYVSGYLHPGAQAELGTPVVGESHAWVEWWLDEWTAHDPTNAAPVLDRHVMVGNGRDYADVPPIKGIVAGDPGATELSVEVTITQVA
ncbi:MAG TPA: transglutaminase family protein [Jatrophihabitans sp.]|jgi:transglutaminase-like putative cysteine protease